MAHGAKGQGRRAQGQGAQGIGQRKNLESNSILFHASRWAPFSNDLSSVLSAILSAPCAVLLALCPVSLACNSSLENSDQASVDGICRRSVMGKVLRDYEVYLIYVDPDRCDSCEECIIMCPTDVFEMPHKAIPVRPQNCLGCLTCTAVCKSKAIIITEI
jgi:NAD-dependent dihydropyrimidine dehydrogenase PreA subunit